MLKEIIYFLIGLIERYEYRNISLDENDINKKILNTISNLDLIVKTDTGYEKVTDIHLTQPYKVYEIVLDNGYKLECADNHILFDKSFNQVFCQDLNTNSSYIQTDKGLSKVIRINKCNQKLSMFDSTINHRNHRFYTNGILSHNTVNAAIAMLHFITFNNDKNIMIVANIRGTTIEIIDKIKNIYIQLPFFLKVGIKNWNQQSIIFENGCRIKSSARSKTPAIGYTIDFLYLDEFAHIPSNIIEPYYKAAFPTVSAIENSKIVITSTPNGMNLFYKLLSDSERPDGDPLKNNYKAMRVYWYQVSGRFVTYFKLNNHKLHDFGLDKNYVFEKVKETFGELTKVELKFNTENLKDVIYVFNNDLCSDEMVKSFTFETPNGKEISIYNISEVSTWKEEAIKDIGGEDSFNQEYGLRFINATRSLLSEHIIENLIQNKKNYIYEKIEELDNRLKFPYDELIWVDDISVFSPLERKSIKGIISVDISEGLGQDYSVINIFKISPKSDDVIETQNVKFTNLSDFFCLEQIGIYRSNHVSVKQLSELFYVLLFEYFDYDNFKVVLELNNYGNEFLAHLPGLFDGNNNYGSSVFFRYKHRVDSNEEKIGLKIGDNKNILVKDYQDCMDKKNYIITNEDNIREITTFVKHITSSGNVRYAADMGHDDTVMTLINTSSIFNKYEFKEMVEDYATKIIDNSKLNYFKSLLGEKEYVEGIDYQSLLNVNRRRRMYNSLLLKNTKTLLG
jgi:hypothetical protein